MRIGCVDVLEEANGKSFEWSLPRRAPGHLNGMLTIVVHAATVRLIQATRILRDRSAENAEDNGLSRLKLRKEW